MNKAKGPRSWHSPFSAPELETSPALIAAVVVTAIMADVDTGKFIVSKAAYNMVDFGRDDRIVGDMDVAAGMSEGPLLRSDVGDGSNPEIESINR